MAEIAEVSGSKPRGRKVLDELRVKRTLDGGHVISHHYQSYEHQPTPYKFGKTQGAMAMQHIAKHAGLPMAGKAEEAEPKEEETEA